MSDPVTNADIEDVLSSIRRLVAEDERPEMVAPPKPAVTDRLVLTPALRVMESEAPEEVPSAESADLLEDEGAAQTDLPEPELVEGHELAGLDIDDSAKRNLEARIAELEAVISDTGGQWEQDGEEGSDNAGGTVESLTWEDEPEAAETPGPEVEEAQMVEMAEEEPSNSDTIAAMPFLRHKFDMPDETDTVEEPVAVEAEEVVEDDPEPSVEPEPIFEEPTDQDAPLEDFPAEEPYEGQDFVVDEEALRALVVEIVHQELQGKLGERITRNVRNLVRREIHRAITSQELE
ncbi:MAG: hypothetical protein ACRBBS_03255 [Thalassovita sp.]